MDPIVVGLESDVSSHGVWIQDWYCMLWIRVVQRVCELMLGGCDKAMIVDFLLVGL